MWTALVPPHVVVVHATPDMWTLPASPAEQAFVRNAVTKRRGEYQAGRAAARAALRSAGVVGFDLLPGRDRAPQWPPGFVGSITHAGSHCAAAVARATDVAALGIDVEQDDPLGATLVPRICTETEAQGLDRLPGADPLVWAKVVFSAKEAFFKAYFPATGRWLDFRDAEAKFRPEQGEFSVTLCDDRAPALCGRRQAHGRFALEDRLILTCVAVDAGRCS